MDDKIKQYKETLSLEKQSPTQVGLLRKGERHLNYRKTSKHKPTECLCFEKESQRNEREMTFWQNAKKSSQVQKCLFSKIEAKPNASGFASKRRKTSESSTSAVCGGRSHSDVFRRGTPGAIRTRGLSLRRRTLYPAELQARMFADKSLCIVPQNAACVNKFLA